MSSIAAHRDQVCVKPTFRLTARKHLFQLATIGIWTLPILSFTTPGEPSPSTLAFLDGLAMVKLAILLAVFTPGLLLVCLHFHRIKSSLTALLPLYAYLGWSLVTVLWTPLLAVSLGQAGGLATQLVLVTLIGLSVRNASEVESILRTLSQMLFAFSLFVFSVHMLYPSHSGLFRDMFVGGRNGVVHPTAAGANSSLGILITALCHFVGRYHWAGFRALLCVIIHAAVLYYSNSRMAFLMVVLTGPLIMILHLSNRRRALVLLAVAASSVAVMLIDPSFRMFVGRDSTALRYVMRGQSEDQIKGVSGRAELWEKVWEEHKKAPLVGHGYFITSESGALDVWYEKTNMSAHNVYLQVLVSTGALGLLLFVVAIATLGFQFLKLFKGDQLARQMAEMLLFVAIWYLGWTLLCESFMGPVRSESVLFYVFVGLGVGQLARRSHVDRLQPIGTRTRGHGQC